MLNLNNNSIENINATILNEFSNSNRRLRLFQNPWKCDCKTYDYLSIFMNNQNNLTELEMFTCYSDKISITKLKKEELCLLPNSYFNYPVIIIILTSNLIIGFIIALFYKYKLEIKIFLYSKNMCLRWIKESEFHIEKTHDIFLSFCHKDEEIVMKELLPKLENIENPYKVCIHVRDWKAGEWIFNNILLSVMSSKRTVIFLTKNFLASTWGMLEFKTAFNHMITENNSKLIIILYEDIGSHNNQNYELRFYLRSNTYIKWGDPNFWNKLYYALPTVEPVEGKGDILPT